MATTSKSNKQAGAKNGHKRLSQSEVVNHIAAKFDLKRAEAKEFFTELTELAGKELKRNGEFILPGFGKLVLAKRKAREGRNPATGETIKIPAKTTLKFRISKAMKETAGVARKK